MLLSAHAIVKTYGLRPVLRGASFELDAGDFVALLGPNGSGKSTLLRVLATLARPDAGQLTICGVDALAHPDRVRAFVNVVTHQPMVYAELTARENLDFHARLHRIENARQKIEAALRRVELLARADDPARTFSRGMTQRLTLARVLLQDAPVVLLDEPFTGLDANSAQNLSAILTELARAGKAILMSTHESRGMDGVSRVVRVADGQLIGEEARERGRRGDKVTGRGGERERG